MKTLLLAACRCMIFFLVLFASKSDAQINSYKIYGTSEDDVIDRIDRCADGGYYLAGYRNLRSDGFLIRADSLGNIVWDKIVDFDSSYVQYVGGGKLKDESYVLIFEEYPSPFLPILTTLIRFDPAGDTLWSSVICCTRICCADDPIIALDNNEFLIAGTHQNLMGQPWAGNIFKIDSLGHMLSQTQFFPESLEVQLNDYALTPQNEIVAVGQIIQPWALPIHGFLIKFDIDGDFISQELYKDSTSLGIAQIFTDTNTYTLQMTDQTIFTTDTAGILISAVANVDNSVFTKMEKVPGEGYYFQAYDSLSRPVLAKTDFNFDTLWTKVYPDLAVFGDINVSPRDHSILLNTQPLTMNNLFGGFDGEVHNIDSTGNSPCLTSQYSSIFFQDLQSNIIAFDTICFSYTGIYPTEILQHQVTIQSGISEGVICNPMKVESQGVKDEIKISPNPVSQNTFKIFTGGSKCEEVRMMTLEGKMIDGAIQQINTGEKEISIRLSELVQNGIYLLLISAEGIEFPVKMVVMK